MQRMIKQFIKTASLFFGLVFLSLGGFSQGIEPLFGFEDMANTHNMKICSDGKFYYTINGGDAKQGMINQYDLDGIWIKSYPLRIDARSLFFNQANGHLYVAAFDKNIYKITDMQLGRLELVYKELCPSEQCSPALSPDGRELFIMNDGTVQIYDFKDGSLLTEFKEIKCGSDYRQGSTSIAADDTYFYTWNSKKQIVYAYDHNGHLKDELQITLGSYPFSISIAGDYLFCAKDAEEESGQGNWYGYKLHPIIGSTPLKLQFQISDYAQGEPADIAFDGSKYYFLNHFGIEKKSMVITTDEKGKKLDEYLFDRSLNSLLYSPRYKLWYANEYFTPGSPSMFYLVDNFKKGKLKPYMPNSYDNPEVSPGMSMSGEHVVIFKKGDIDIYDIRLKQKVDARVGLLCGETTETGAYAIAVAQRYLFTWNARLKLVYQYSMKGDLIATFRVPSGSYGPSISYVNNMLWVATDQKGSSNTWYAYIIPNI